MALVALALGTAALGGCGGDNARTAFAARGDRLCSAARARARAIPPVADTAPPAAQAAYLRRVTPAARQELGQLQALRPPQDDAATVHAYLQAQLAQITTIEKASAALAAGDTTAARSGFQAALALAPHIQALAKQAGFRVCSSEFS
jgi:hypothetical protein